MSPTGDVDDWLAAADRQEVPFGPTVVSAVLLDDSDLDEFLAAARQVRDAGLFALVSRRPALMRGQKTDDPVGWRDLECVVETVGDCAALPMSAVDGSIKLDDYWSEQPYFIRPRIPPFPCVIGGTSTIRYLASHADDPPPDRLICLSQNIRSDFHKYFHLWTGPDSNESGQEIVDRIFDSSNARSLFAYGLERVPWILMWRSCRSVWCLIA